MIYFGLILLIILILNIYEYIYTELKESLKIPFIHFCKVISFNENITIVENELKEKIVISNLIYKDILYDYELNNLNHNVDIYLTLYIKDNIIKRI